MGFAIALGLGLIVILAVGRGSEVRAQNQPGPTPPPPGPAGQTAEQLERKRLLVQRGYLAALQKRVAFLTSKRVTENQQESKNNIATYFQSKGVPLQKPDPRLPFWQLSEPAVGKFISQVVNSYTPVAVGPAQMVSGEFPTYVR